MASLRVKAIALKTRLRAFGGQAALLKLLLGKLAQWTGR